MSIANCKKMIWKLQEENAQLRETLSILVQSVDEDPALIKYFFLANKCRKLKDTSVEHATVLVKEFAAKAKQKQWGVENKLKKTECQLKTLAIDSKTREQVQPYLTLSSYGLKTSLKLIVNWINISKSLKHLGQE